MIRGRCGSVPQSCEETRFTRRTRRRGGEKGIDFPFSPHVPSDWERSKKLPFSPPRLRVLRVKQGFFATSPPLRFLPLPELLRSVAPLPLRSCNRRSGRGGAPRHPVAR